MGASPEKLRIPRVIPEAEWAVLTEDRQTVLATVRYQYAEDRSPSANAYALSGESLSDIPFPGDTNGPEKFNALHRAKRLVWAHTVQTKAQNLYLVYDCPLGVMWYVGFDFFEPGYLFGRTYVNMPDGQFDPEMVELPPFRFKDQKEFWNYIAARGLNAYITDYQQIGTPSLFLPNSEGVTAVLNVQDVIRTRPMRTHRRGV